MDPSSSALENVEAMLENIVDSLLVEKPLSISLRVRPILDPALSNQPPTTIDAPTTTLSFPGKTAREAWRFSPTSNIHVNQAYD